MSDLQRKAESDISTPYAVRCWCNNRELVYMCREFYMDQLNSSDNKWICPRCFQEASWDDKNYEDYINAIEYMNFMAERTQYE